MRFLITGGTGFLGSYVARNFLHHGHEVICLDHSPDPEMISHFLPEITVIQGDVSELGLVGKILGENPVDGVAHLAYVMGAEAEAHPTTAMRVNALGTANVFEQACKCGVKRILFTSSESIYGKSQSAYGDRPVTEEDFCSPKEHVLNYSLTKLLNEHLAEKYETRFGTEIVSLRIAIVYGAGRKRGATVWASDFAALPALAKPVTLPFPADDWHCCIYVEDVAEEIYQLLTKPHLGHRIYNSGGHTVQAADLEVMVREVIPEARILFSADRPCSPFIYRMDHSRIGRELSFEQRSMIEGIRNHISCARKLSYAGKL
jgi:nucleoside-diphosphate-sugar epimerase